MMERVDAQRVSAPSALAIAGAGSAAVATAYGMARYGYGLLLPDIQHDLMLGVGALGVIGSLAYVSYLAATASVPFCVQRLGARATVTLGGALAVAGTVVVALATGPLLLGAGVGIAGTSAGLVYAPFGDAVHQLPPLARARTLATISCGTGWGVAIAAPIAILAGDAWRAAYLGFAACAALSTLLAARILTGRAASSTVRTTTCSPQRGLRRSAFPMITAALLIGLGSATFWTFAVDHVRNAGLDQTAGRVLLGIAGITSLTALVTADIIGRLGPRATFVLTALLEAAAVATIALAADNLAAVLIAAAAFGGAYNTIVAVTILWATRVYPDRPSAGVAIATGAQGIGLLAGPLAGGLLGETAGLTTALLAGASILGLAALLAPHENLIHYAEPTYDRDGVP